MAEHTMVVGFVKNDLGIIANNVRVDRFRYVDIINAGDKELLASKFTNFNKFTKWLDWKNRGYFFSWLPAGSITGTPKKNSWNFRKLEDYNRDFYTGIFLVFWWRETWFFSDD